MDGTQQRDLAEERENAALNSEVDEETVTVEWEVRSKHSRTLTLTEAAELHGVTVERFRELRDAGELNGSEELDWENNLAGLDDNGFEYLTREDVEVG